MLLRLPSELIYCIATFLPTVGCLTRLAQTCRQLYNIIAADKYRIFQAFLQGQYPAIVTPPIWRDAAHALTLRSRAFERHAVTGRFVLTPANATRIGIPRTIRTDKPTLGYRPVIDSYESWYENNWFARKEVLAWGAGADLVLRIKDLGSRSNGCPDELEANGASRSESSYDGATWMIFNDLHDVNSWDDIAGLHLLGAGSPSAASPDTEDLILGRRNGEVTYLSIHPKDKCSSVKARFDTHGKKLDYTDLSAGPDRVLAVALERKSFSFYNLAQESEIVQPFASIETASYGPSRNRCSKMLSNRQVAIGADGEAAKIDIFSFGPDEVKKERIIRVDVDIGEPSTGNARVTTIVPFSVPRAAGGASSNLFLSGWEDSKVRLHDIRSPKPCVAVYGDTVDNSPVYCLLPIGHERLIVGSGANALVKIFDLRMGRNGHIEARVGSSSVYGQSRQHIRSGSSNNHIPLDSISYPRRDISIYLCNELPKTTSNNRAQPYVQSRRYRGPIYGMSLPSPTSSTVYVGLVNRLVRLDMVGTDAILQTGDQSIQKNWSIKNLSSAIDPKAATEYQPFDLSSYERPLPDDQGRGLRLMIQSPIWETSKGLAAPEGSRAHGWDERWFQPWNSRNNTSDKRHWRRNTGR